ncbi:hypothetical protein [Halioxenophilus aromaticivorans]|uniref:Uncharacterized protein n=1 Tax=Halioxenophilus aromaticivorans TaxID=1306992 RepID=A0AAV3U2B8_9ALTE
MAKMIKAEDYIGEYVKGVTLETCRDPHKSRPRVKAVDHFVDDIRVEFPRKLRELFPIGTQYMATVKVCQKHSADGKPSGKPYLSASDIGLIPESVPDQGLIAQVKAGSVSGLAYEYHFESTF